ncbi:MAG: cytochrome c oxidase subunit II [Caldilineaceae bacterium]|nr:cytochrome c oxidase subunit II [Caldilineaceae bacterium]
MQNNQRHFVIAGVLVVISTFLVYWLLDTVLKMPVQASMQAFAIDRLFDYHIWLIAFLFSLVVVFMLYALVVFRHRAGEDEDKEGEYFHGNVRLEIAWTLLPLIFVVFFAFESTRVLINITREDPDEYVVIVTGQQFAWSFEYPDTGLKTGELVLPVDQPIRLEMTSADVLHNFWVPEFRVKQDLLPGFEPRILRFTPVEEGEYQVRCAELCGLNHSGMRAPVRVVPQDEFAAWINQQVASK